MAEIGNHVGNEPWPSLEVASWLFDRASFVLIGSLVFGAVATVVIVWMGIVKEHHWDLLRERSNEKVAGLEAETAKAQADGETAKADAAKARAEIAEASKQTESAKAVAAEANRKAESERLERLKLELVVAPRSLSLEQQRSLAAIWKQFAGKRVAVISYSLDGEGASLATQIMASMVEAGIVIDNRLASTMPMGGFALGVHVSGTDTSVVNELRSGLRLIGSLMVAPSGSPQGGGTSMGVGVAPDASVAPLAAEVLVGIKPVATIR